MFGMCLQLSHKLEHQLRLSLDQKHVLRQTLIQELGGPVLRTEGKCPGCLYKLNLKEIFEGFADDTEDTTTECPRCRRRFQAILLEGTAYGRMEVSFFCPDQVLSRLEKLEGYTPEKIRGEFAAVYYSALSHFGTLKEAFGKINVRYAHDVLKHWKDRVQPFLGEYPDGLIAACVGKSRSSIQSFRASLEIDPYSNPA